MKEEVSMKRKIPKKQIVILCGGITATIILVTLVMLFIRKAGKNDNIAVTKIAEETTASLDRTTRIEKETTSKETATSTEQVTTERELETTTELIVATTNPPTTAKPTEPVTQPETTNPPPPQTSASNSSKDIQYRDPYTWEIISKEEYDSIMNEINNPELNTQPPTKENIYVLNDDGTINFKKSKIYNTGYNLEGGELEFLNLCENSHEVKQIIGEELYPLITNFALSWSSASPTPSFFACINDEYWLAIKFDENWNIEKGWDSGCLSKPENLPVKEEW